MMHKKTLVTLLILCSAAYVYAAVNMGASDITIAAGTKKSVQCPHKTHQSATKDCSACHSAFPQKSGSIRALIDGGTMKSRTIMDICRGCHQEMKQQGQKTGPTACGVCHSG